MGYINTAQFKNTGLPGQTRANPGGSAGGSGAAYGMLASGVISSIGSIVESHINAGMIKDQYEFKASMLNLQSRMQELQGRMVRIGADVEIRRIRKNADLMYGHQRAAYANAGVKMAGSPAAVMLNSMKEYELDAIYTDINATYNIDMVKYQADTTRNQAELESAQGRMAKYGAYQENTKTLLSMGTEALKEL